MRYESARNFRAAIDARLKRLAGTTDESHLVRARRGIAFERFLARLFTTAPDRWTLKGGLALDYRLGDKARATKDIDLITPLGIDELEEDLVEALGADLGDFFDYSIRSSRVLDLATEGSARRYHIRADLDGRQFGNFTVDIGFDKPSPIAPDHSTGRGFLEFAGVERIAMPVIAIEIHLAEKIHAYCRTYAGNRQNTRVKGLIDIVLIGETQELRAGKVRLAIDHTFGSRGSGPLPTRLEAPPAAWAVPYRELARSVSLDPDIGAGHTFATAIIEPLLGDGLDPKARWDTSTRLWAPHP